VDTAVLPVKPVGRSHIVCGSIGVQKAAKRHQPRGTRLRNRRSDLTDAVSEGRRWGRNFVERRRAATISLDGQISDQSVEWEKDYYYRAAVVTVVNEAGTLAAQVEGDDTPE